ncbi:glycosyltransferase family 2 protein [Dyadobacter psychrophilus]|uniref:Glycosyltransferase, catalytic subunit of cellulose synthase and poly-beta-1,6-N-acetylglucosamine synthase n=1 Tax=Dyadobacter psychrophilus TaxID=651661 RepID=A0A1T5FV34_9BACT|nr:cellulose synthase catalytic subunit [Dyadobacter psychrophilus]SKC00018.1 Glycosyltransferase, catalytic subunit of cellulose synthase and poly-beta-1,6-N-acetylglucosamine synthase [Dyadobacter psychrophilus]
MKRISVKPPTRIERITLHIMIVIGCVAIAFFLNSVFAKSVRGYAPLYWMLLTTFVFSCLKLLYEWYHYLHIIVPKTPPFVRDFTVDIFTTFCPGEPYEMIIETLTAIKAINYPHETYLCDEADDAYLKQVCKDLGVHHITRTDKKDAKAGNINNALRQSSGELCVVLDPDHVPFPEFLDPIVSHFNNPEIGYVQVVQAYKNSNESLIAKGAAQQTYQFYGPMMMTMNKYGTVLAIGANCTFRRTALDSIGGHAAGLAEDMHTSMQLHAKGWKSVYVPEVLARGLVPSTLSAYYKQQLKWSRGVFDLLVHVYPKLFSQFTWRQRLHYGLIPMHYLSGIIFLINFLIPIISLFFGLSPMQFDIFDFGQAVFPLITALVLIRHFVQWWVMEDDERGFHMVGGLLLIGTWWIFILGLVYTIIGKKVPYVPTPKDGNEANNWPLNIPNLIILALSIAAIAYGLLTDWNPYNLIMAAFAALNCFFMCFTIAASRQQQFRILRSHHPLLDAAMKRLKVLKGLLWIFRHHLYTGLRNTAMVITILLLSIWIYNARFDLLPGEIIRHADKKTDIPLRFFPIAITWKNDTHIKLPMPQVDSAYQAGLYPVLNLNIAEDAFYENILNGSSDTRMIELAMQLKALHRPVFIHFASMVSNAATRDSTKGIAPEQFGEAWKHLNGLFNDHGAYNVVWMHHVWAPEGFDTYNPSESSHDQNQKVVSRTAVPKLSVFPQPVKPAAQEGTFFKDTKGINYLKGAGWAKSYRAFKKKELLEDFAEMKKIGINTVKVYGPSFYDHNILKTAKEQNLSIHYGFWVSDTLNFSFDKETLAAVSKSIISTVQKHKDNERIVAWNIGNPVFQKIAHHYQQPILMYQRDSYLIWLQNLIKKMKEVDPSRPVTIDVEATESMPELVKRIQTVIPEIASYGLIINDNTDFQYKELDFPHFISYMGVPAYQQLEEFSGGVFISNWQDTQSSDRVSFDALKDQTGRYKNTFFKLASVWNHGRAPGIIPKVRILKPATGIFPDLSLDFHAIIQQNGQWILANKSSADLTFEWKLVQIDYLTNPLAITELGTGPDVTLQIPYSPESYRLYLFVMKGETILDVVNSPLNTPLSP